MDYNPDTPPDQAAINTTVTGCGPLGHGWGERDTDGEKKQERGMVTNLSHPKAKLL